jgi:Asp/Glu/hydantoin racemase
MPGNVVNASTYPFPVRMIPVKNINCDELFACDDKVQSAIEEACRQLVKEGVRAISGACGFFGNYQKSISGMFDVPVSLSSLMQVPWLLSLIKPNQKLAILTADEKSITERLLINCGITKEMKERLVIKDLASSDNFSCVIKNWGEWDNSLARADVVGKAIEAVSEHDDVAAILLECSDMPPYASSIQRETGLPVFDFITLIKWLHSAVAQKPYEGFI